MERSLLLLLIARFHRIYLSFGRYVCRFQGGEEETSLLGREKRRNYRNIYIYIG